MFRRMFDNPGELIKKVAKIVFIIGIIITVISSIYVFLLYARIEMGFLRTIITSIVVLVIGLISSWLSTIVLYGMGELIDNSTKMIDAIYVIEKRNIDVRKDIEEMRYVLDVVYRDVIKQDIDGEMETIV